MLQRLAIAMGVAAAALASAGSHLAARRNPAVQRLAREYVSAYFERNPQLGMVFGWPGADETPLPDHSLAAEAAWQAREDALREELGRLDPASLEGSDRIEAALLRERLDGFRDARVCRSELWPVSSIWGWQQQFPQMGNGMRVDTPEARRRALARWRDIPRWLDQEVMTLQEGIRRGYTSSRSNVESALAQIDTVLSTPPERSPLATWADRARDEPFAREVRVVVAERIVPAAKRYQEFLARDYLPAARASDAVAANPNGAACYRALLRVHTGLDLSPQAVHDLGLRQMEAIEAEMRSVVARSFGGAELPRVFEQLRSDPRYTFRSREEIVERARSALERARVAMPRWFGITTSRDVELVPYPETLERGAPGGSYRAGGRDRSGTYFVNTATPRERSVADAEAIAFHEMIPGHHLQISIALERAGDRLVAVYLPQTTFTEGWGLYAERLADEMGLYSGDVDRLGMLSMQALRAARLVVDSGVHGLGWTREQAIRYLAEHTSMPRAVIAAEVDRYIASPGQATAYMIGMLEIRGIRAEAERALGARFDVKAFHDRVLEGGAVSLPLLREKIEGWVRDGGKP